MLRVGARVTRRLSTSLFVMISHLSILTVLHVTNQKYSDRPYEMTGHCYVIYGYRRFKDSTTFIINDSDSLSTRAEIFGRQAGNGDELEANFSLWSIQRFVSDVTVVG